MMDTVLVLAHGSGQPSDSPWMNMLSSELERLGASVHRFNFEYMTLAQKAGKPRPPSRLPKLTEEYRSVVESLGGRQIFVAGKSLGGHVASHLATEIEVAGWVAFGYPFHPPGKPEKLRTDHLPNLKCPGLICQGERDPFGKREEVEALELPDRLQIVWLPAGDHQFKATKRSGVTLEENIRKAAQATRNFMTQP